MDQPLTKTLVALGLVFIMVFSFFVLGKIQPSPSFTPKVSHSIDEKMETVLALTTVTTFASAVVSLLPDDTATPIAEKLADFTEYFLLVLCVLFVEKNLLTILGAAVFKVLIPVVCLVLLGGLFFKSEKANKLAVKMLAVGLALYFLIPCSILVSDRIYDTYRETIDNTVTSAQALTDEANALDGQRDNTGFLSSLAGTMARLRNTIRQFVETLAILIATSCLIPLLTLAFFLWLIRQLTGLDIPIRLGRARTNHPHGTDQGETGA